MEGRGGHGLTETDLPSMLTDHPAVMESPVSGPMVWKHGVGGRQSDVTYHEAALPRAALLR